MVNNALEVRSSESFVQSTQPFPGLVTWLSHYAASNSKIITLPKWHLICIWHILSFHCH
jgi:hypothetical protein